MMKRIPSRLSLLPLLLGMTFGCAQKDQFYSNVMRADLFTQVYSEDKYDFLWVFDNSTSMFDRINYVKDNFSQFLTLLTTHKAIDFQMAVTTGDFFTDGAKLVANGSGMQVVKSSSPNPINDFSSIVGNIKDTPTSFWDQDLESAYQAVYQHGSVFMRTGVPLIVIIITDADDYSCQSHCWGVEPRHNPDYVAFPIERYINYFQNLKTPENTTVSVYPIIGQPTSTCAVEDYGMRYLELSKALGNGAVGSVCIGDIGAAYNAVANSIADRGRTFKLTTVSSGKNMTVWVNGQKVPYSADNGYTFDVTTNSITFSGQWIPPKGASIEVTYDQNTN